MRLWPLSFKVTDSGSKGYPSMKPVALGCALVGVGPRGSLPSHAWAPAGCDRMATCRENAQAERKQRARAQATRDRKGLIAALYITASRQKRSPASVLESLCYLRASPVVAALRKASCLHVTYSRRGGGITTHWTLPARIGLRSGHRKRTRRPRVERQIRFSSHSSRRCD